MWPEDEPKVRKTRAVGPITNLRRSRLTFPLHEDRFDNEADSPRFEREFTLSNSERGLGVSLHSRPRQASPRANRGSEAATP